MLKGGRRIFKYYFISYVILNNVQLMEYNGQYKYTFNSLYHQKFTYLNWPEIFSSLLIGGQGDCPKFLYLELTK